MTECHGDTCGAWVQSWDTPLTLMDANGLGRVHLPMEIQWLVMVINREVFQSSKDGLET